MEKVKNKIKILIILKCVKKHKSQVENYSQVQPKIIR